MVPYKPYVCGKHVESILGTRKNMTKKVFILNNTIPHSVRLVNPFLFKVDLELLFDDADVASNTALMASRLDAIQVERGSRVCYFGNSIPFVHGSILQYFGCKKLHQLKFPINNQPN